MKWIELQGREFYDELNNEFFEIPGCKFKIEHSLVSLYKWESKWKVPFLHTKLTKEQLIDYVRCMTITQNVNPMCYRLLTNSMLSEIEYYINEQQTATTINHVTPQKPQKKEIITAEIIYYWMVSYQIPFECEKWHLSKLLTLIEVCSIKNNVNGKKMTKSEVLKQNAKLNAARRAARHSKG